MSVTVYTYGYAGLTANDFINQLQAHTIRQLIDVRRFPNSKTNPDFNQGIIRKLVEERGISYFWLGESLGGYRDGGYPVYMKSPAFSSGISDLIRLIQSQRSAIFCLERKYTQCHRRFIADELVRQNFHVKHIIDAQTSIDHVIQTDLFH
ncbi:DUF488 domain-containing protein [candidate division KSB1 bacterium]|nr:DUF488 domain-containing protein [candidate division KSB1 bacterium]